MDQTLQPHELKDWAEKLERAFDEAEGARNARAVEQAVVTGPDGISRYRTQELWQEITFLGYHLHWDLSTLLDLEHGDRRMLVRQVADLNEQAWDEVKRRG